MKISNIFLFSRCLYKIRGPEKWVRVPAATLDDLSSIPKIHMMGGQNQVLQVVLYTHTHRHTHIHVGLVSQSTWKTTSADWDTPLLESVHQAGSPSPTRKKIALSIPWVLGCPHHPMRKKNMITIKSDTCVAIRESQTYYS